MLQRRDSWKNSEVQDQRDGLGKGYIKAYPLNPSKTNESECETLRGKKSMVCDRKSGIPIDPPVFGEYFADVWINDKTERGIVGGQLSSPTS